MALGEINLIESWENPFLTCTCLTFPHVPFRTNLIKTSTKNANDLKYVFYASDNAFFEPLSTFSFLSCGSRAIHIRNLLETAIRSLYSMGSARLFETLRRDPTFDFF